MTYEVIDGFSSDAEYEVSAIGRQYTNKRTGTVYWEKHPELGATLTRGKVSKHDFVKQYMNNR